MQRARTIPDNPNRNADVEWTLAQTLVTNFYPHRPGMYGQDGLHAWSCIQPDQKINPVNLGNMAFLDRMREIENSRVYQPEHWRRSRGK